jgi:hypothetical protein
MNQQISLVASRLPSSPLPLIASPSPPLLYSLLPKEKPAHALLCCSRCARHLLNHSSLITHRIHNHSTGLRPGRLERMPAPGFAPKTGMLCCFFFVFIHHPYQLSPVITHHSSPSPLIAHSTLVTDHSLHETCHLPCTFPECPLSQVCSFRSLLCLFRLFVFVVVLCIFVFGCVSVFFIVSITFIHQVSWVVVLGCGFSQQCLAQVLSPPLFCTAHHRNLPLSLFSVCDREPRRRTEVFTKEYW